MEVQNLEEVCGELIVPRYSTFSAGLRCGSRQRMYFPCEDFLGFFYRVSMSIEIDDSFIYTTTMGYVIGYIMPQKKK